MSGARWGRRGAHPPWCQRPHLKRQWLSLGAGGGGCSLLSQFPPLCAKAHWRGGGAFPPSASRPSACPSARPLPSPRPPPCPPRALPACCLCPFGVPRALALRLAGWGCSLGGWGGGCCAYAPRWRLGAGGRVGVSGGGRVGWRGCRLGAAPLGAAPPPCSPPRFVPSPPLSPPPRGRGGVMFAPALLSLGGRCLVILLAQSVRAYEVVNVTPFIRHCREPKGVFIV